jgi:hypothetical protein
MFFYLKKNCPNPILTNLAKNLFCGKEKPQNKGYLCSSQNFPSKQWLKWGKLAQPGHHGFGLPG